MTKMTAKELTDAIAEGVASLHACDDKAAANLMEKLQGFFEDASMALIDDLAFAEDYEQESAAVASDCKKLRKQSTMLEEISIGLEEANEQNFGE